MNENLNTNLTTSNKISSTEELIADLKQGKMIVLVDEEDRENEGDLLMVADFVTPQDINFMATHGKGLICLTLTKEQCTKLQLPLMVPHNKSGYGTNFTISIEAAQGVTTGISAQDRATTIQTAVKPHATPDDIVQPGHIFPLMAQEGGVLVRAGHTEAGCDLAKLAGGTSSAVICEILKEDGTMARLPDLIEFAQKHQLKIGTIVDLIQYRQQSEPLVQLIEKGELVTEHGIYQTAIFQEKSHPDTAHIALFKTALTTLDTSSCENYFENSIPWVRVHEPSSILQILSKQPSHNSRYSITETLEFFETQSDAVLVLLHANTGIFPSLQQKTQKIHGGQQNQQLRNYGLGAQILQALGVKKMRVFGTQRKMPSMAGFGLEIVE